MAPIWVKNRLLMQLHPSGATSPWKCSSESSPWQKKSSDFKEETLLQGDVVPTCVSSSPSTKSSKSSRMASFCLICSFQHQPAPRNEDLVRQNREGKTCFEGTNEKTTLLILAHTLLKPPEKSKDFVPPSWSFVSSKLARI